MCACDLLGQRDTEVARVEEAGLGVDPRLGLELRHAERPVDEEHRGDREGDQPRIEVPERREDDTEGRQHELRREPVEREEARILDRVAAREHEHRREQRVVQPDEDDRGRAAGEREAQVTVRDQPVSAQDESTALPHAASVARMWLQMLKRLDVPGRSVLQPGRDVLGDCDEHDELGRKEQDRREQEDLRRVVRLVPRRLDEQRPARAPSPWRAGGTPSTAERCAARAGAAQHRHGCGSGRQTAITTR